MRSLTRADNFAASAREASIAVITRLFLSPGPIGHANKTAATRGMAAGINVFREVGAPGSDNVGLEGPRGRTPM